MPRSSSSVMVSPRPSAGDRRLPELATEDLSRRRLGKLLDEFDLPRHLVTSEAIPAVSLQLLDRRRHPGSEADEGLDRLPAVLVGDTHDGDLPNGWVLVERILDLPRPDLVAGGIDLVLLAVHHVEPTLGVHEPHVARAEPPVTEGVGGLLGVLPVARDDLRTRQGDLS